MIILDELKKIKNIEFLFKGNFQNFPEISGISIDSRTIKNNELFFALKGEKFDGHSFVEDVLNKGAYGAVIEKKYANKISERFEVEVLMKMIDKTNSVTYLELVPQSISSSSIYCD
jgi:UDP-N-acetylmuramoyl-tripeptide--D-alanyl-D-alanine ligase